MLCHKKSRFRKVRREAGRLVGSLPLKVCIWLVVSTPLKNMKVNWDYCSQYMEKMFQTTLCRFAQRTALGQEYSTLVCGIHYGERDAFVTGMGILSNSQDCLRKGPTENNCSHRSTAPSHWAHQGITRQQANIHTTWLAGVQ